MLTELKILSKETAVYGLSTVVGRLLNILLLPLYTHCLTPTEYGIVATVFSYIAFLNVLYGYGMDFAFMRHTETQDSSYFSTAFWSLLISSLGLSGLIHLFSGAITAVAGIAPELSDITRYAAWILALDAMALLPFAQLRMSHRAGLYAGIKVVNIVINLALNYVFLFKLSMGVRGVFLASLTTSAATFLLLLPIMIPKLKLIFDLKSYQSLLRSALPLVPAGLASMMVQVIDRPILKFLTNDASVGIYQANYRLGIFMMMAVNMFDASWRPFFIEKARQDNAPQILSRVLTYFTLAASCLFLFITLFVGPVIRLPLIGGKSIIHPAYWGGLSIVPVVTLGYLFNGIYVNMLAPVTIKKRSEFVAYATGLGALVNVASNFALIPRWGMMGAAWATALAYAAMALALFAMGRKVYPIDYEIRRLSHLALCLMLVLGAAQFLGIGMSSNHLLWRLGLLAAFPITLVVSGFFNEEERLALKKRLGKQV